MKNIIYITIGLCLIVSFEVEAQYELNIEGDLLVGSIDSVASIEQVLVVQADGKVTSSAKESFSGLGSVNKVELHPDWENYGAGYGDVTVYRDQNNVFIDGLIEKINSNIVVGDTLFVLTKEYWPSKSTAVLASQQSKTVGLFVLTDGAVIVGSTALTTLNHGWISLDGFSFYSNSYKVGDLVKGGYIFYIANPLADLNGDGVLDHGFVAAPYDLEDSEWGCFGTDIPGADLPSIGEGFDNTEDIINACTENNIAAKRCMDLVINGYDDWFLPSSLELIEMINSIGPTAIGTNQNIGNFDTSSSYWSSTEYNLDAARKINPSTGTYFISFKTNLSKIRAIRVF